MGRYYSQWASPRFIGQKFGKMICLSHNRDDRGQLYTTFKCSVCGRLYTTYTPRNIYVGRVVGCKCNKNKKEKVFAEVENLQYIFDYKDDLKRKGRYYTYIWYDRNNIPFYVGKGCTDRCLTLNQRTDDFIKKRNAIGSYCVLYAKNCNNELAKHYENKLIKQFVLKGHKLLNKTGNPKYTLEQHPRVYETIGGLSLPLSEWCDIVGTSWAQVKHRTNKWDFPLATALRLPSIPRGMEKHTYEYWQNAGCINKEFDKKCELECLILALSVGLSDGYKYRSCIDDYLRSKEVA